MGYISKKQHIPALLQDKILELKNISYKEILKDFINEYQPNSYENIYDEYQLINKYLLRISDLLSDKTLDSIIKKNLGASTALVIMDEEIKERFIHPFQNFLIGTTIIDHFYDKFKIWIEKGDNSINKIELSWFLASIFHDIGRPLLAIMGVEDNETSERKMAFRDHQKYIDKLSSFFEFIRTGNNYIDWNTSIKLTNEDFSRVILNYYQSNDHGVMSSFNLLADLEKIYEEEAFNPFFMQALLVICLHNRDVYNRLLEEKLFPFNIEHFPLLCVLLYCDSTHEWNRSVETSDVTELEGLEISDSQVNLFVRYHDPKVSAKKGEEIECISRCISPQSEIVFWFRSNVQVSFTP